jgi:hypothetical protein
VKASGNHQVQHHPEIVIESEGDALSDAPQLSHGLVFNLCYGWLGCAEQKGAGQSCMLKRLIDDARL